MHYRTIGNTELHVSEIAFGCGDNAGLMISGTLDEQCSVVERALELGINYFDTAAGYGANRSEVSLGQVLRRLGVRPVICTKIELEPSQLDDIAGGVVSSIEGSLQRLQLDSVDIAMIHNSPMYERPAQWNGWMPLTIDEYLGPKGALEGLERLRRAGKARFFGIVNERADVALARQLIDTGQFALLNVQYNLLNPTAGMPLPHGLKVDLDNGNLVSYAAERGMSAAIFSPMARGLLTDRSVAEGYRHPLAGTGLTRNAEAYGAALARARTLRFLSNETRTLAQAAVRFLLMHSGVATVLGGFTAVEHVDEMAAASGMDPLSAEDLARVEMVWRSNFGNW